MNRKSKMGLFAVTALITAISLIALKKNCPQMYGGHCGMHQTECHEGWNKNNPSTNHNGDVLQNK